MTQIYPKDNMSIAIQSAFVWKEEIVLQGLPWSMRGRSVSVDVERMCFVIHVTAHDS